MREKASAVVVVAPHQERLIDPVAVRSLYDAVHWWPDRRLDDIAAILAANPAIGAWEGGQLVGFARAVTNGRLRAYTEDVAVHPDYRRNGIATALLERLLDALGPIETISLFCEPELVDLYARLGFKARRSQVVMHRSTPRQESTT